MAMKSKDLLLNHFKHLLRSALHPPLFLCWRQDDKQDADPLLIERQSLLHAQRLSSCNVKSRVLSEPCIISQHGQPMLFGFSRSSSLKPSLSVSLDAWVCYIKVVASGELFKQSSETAESSGAHERQKTRPHSHSSRKNYCFQGDSLGVASPRIIIHLFGSSD